ncbi:MAG: hypothetical protein CL567_01685 [Alphaproteobacteria bacterium]|nr:hypothetical protein [Alphaproteobacteria bacterium]|tara:strand:+ start:6970 stop:7431 length:462 start_codon:yes stop_codon:yes gene_type:complete
MLKKFKKFFGESNSEVTNKNIIDDKLKLGAAALLVEAALMDENFDDNERLAITKVLMNYFNLTEQESDLLLTKAEFEQEKAIDIYRFTQSINDAVSISDRKQVIQMLWEVVYADGILDKYESALIRQLTGLLHITDSESAEAKRQALKARPQK